MTDAEQHTGSLLLNASWQEGNKENMYPISIPFSEYDYRIFNFVFLFHSMERKLSRDNFFSKSLILSSAVWSAV